MLGFSASLCRCQEPLGTDAQRRLTIVDSLTSVLFDFRGCGIDTGKCQNVRDMLPEGLSVPSVISDVGIFE